MEIVLTETELTGFTITGASTGTITTSGMGQWDEMVFKDFIEWPDKIEMIYTQRSSYSRAGGLPPYHDERAVKIIYSCVNGKWNKSEPIYGNIIPAQDEYYEFQD